MILIHESDMILIHESDMILIHESDMILIHESDMILIHESDREQLTKCFIMSGYFLVNRNPRLLNCASFLHPYILCHMHILVSTAF